MVKERIRKLFPIPLPPKESFINSNSELAPLYKSTNPSNINLQLQEAMDSRLVESSVAKRGRLCGGGADFEKGLTRCTTKDLCGCCTFNGVYAGKSSPFDHLTDDLFVEILLRVPVKPLHRSKCVSKRWLSLISAPSFARSFILARLRKEITDDADYHQPPNKMILFKIHGSRRGQVYALPLHHDDFNKVSSSLSGSFPVTFDFIPALRRDNYDLHTGLNHKGVTEKLLVDIDLKGACGGLVLLQGTFQDRTDVKPFFLNLPYFYYYVCNPTTKQWAELPLTSTRDIVGFTCYYRQLAEDESRDSKIWADDSSCDDFSKHTANYDPNKIEFTVVSINRKGMDDVFIIRVFCSADETPGWSIFYIPFPPGYRWMTTHRKNEVLFFNGKIHWCGDNCIVVYDSFNQPLQCDIIEFPPIEAYKLLFLEAFEGHLRLVTVLRNRRISVWELVDYTNKVWVRKFDVTVEDPHLIFQSFTGDATGDKAYMVANPSTIMVYDVRNASLQHIYSYPISLDNGLNFRYVETFFSSLWPTLLPKQRRKLTGPNNFTHKLNYSEGQMSTI